MMCTLTFDMVKIDADMPSMIEVSGGIHSECIRQPCILCTHRFAWTAHAQRIVAFVKVDVRMCIDKVGPILAM